MHRADTTPAQVLREAAAAARRRIRDDSQCFTGDLPVLALFAILEKRLFDDALDVNGLLAANEVSREARDRFVARFGSLKRYLDELRVEAAARLLRDTDLRISEVGREVGLPVPRTLQRTFHRVLGTSPQEHRRRSREEPDAEPDVEDTSEATLDAAEPPDSELALPELAARWRRRMTLGLAGDRDAAELRGLLRQRYPHLGGARPPLPGWVRRPVQLLPTGDALGIVVAIATLRKVVRMDDAAQRHALLHGLRFELATVFPLLREVAGKLVVDRHAKAPKLAELLVEVVDAHAAPGPDGADWRALAWASLGQLRLAARDYAGAEQALTYARAEWSTPRPRAEAGVEAEIDRLEGGLRRIQRRYPEAVRCFDRALELFPEPAPHPSFHIICRFERAELALVLEDPETCLRILDELADLVSGEPIKQIDGLLAAMRARAAAMAGDAATAESSFRRARELLGDDGFDGARVLREEARFRHRSGWREEAEALLRQAADTFDQLGQPIWTAATRAELAALRPPGAEELEELAAFFDGLPLHREARSTARFLRSLEEAAGADALAELRRGLDLVVLDLYTVRTPEAAEKGSQT